MRIMKKYTYLVVLSLTFLYACNENNRTPKKESKVTVKTISKKAQEIRDYMKPNLIIAHRGSTYWTPEETQVAFLWARNMGADYLEFDIQQTKDGALVAFHDNDLSRTTNVKDIFPDRLKNPINTFTLKELRKLDAGSSFNNKNPDRAKVGFKGLKIMTLRDIIRIAEGYRIKSSDSQPVKEIINNQWTGQYEYEKDPNDTGNRPGIYIETKNPTPNVEKKLAEALTQYGWNSNKNPKEIKTFENKVGIANTKARVVLQTFSKESAKLLEQFLPNIPKCLLLWQPDMLDNIPSNMRKAIRFCIENNIEIMGTSIAGEPNNYKELTSPQLAKMVHDAGMVLHPYTFDTKEQLKTYKDRVEGVFTNRTDLALSFYGRKSKKTPQEILTDLGFE